MSAQYIDVGEISGVFGVKGWVKVFSFTELRENILDYSPWLLKKGESLTEVEVIDGKLQGKAVVAHLKGFDDRDAAAGLIGSKIQIEKSLLPDTKDGEYYWHDLIGLKVQNLDGVEFGIVDSMLETGANDVVVVKGDRERLIPFVQPQTIVNINLDEGIMQVDWDADF